MAFEIKKEARNQDKYFLSILSCSDAKREQEEENFRFSRSVEIKCKDVLLVPMICEKSKKIGCVFLSTTAFKTFS